MLNNLITENKETHIKTYLIIKNTAESPYALEKKVILPRVVQLAPERCCKNTAMALSKLFTQELVIRQSLYAIIWRLINITINTYLTNRDSLHVLKL